MGVFEVTKGIFVRTFSGEMAALARTTHNFPGTSSLDYSFLSPLMLVYGARIPYVGK